MDEHEVRIVETRRPDGTVGVTLVDPKSGRVVETGLKAADSTQAREAQADQVAEVLKRKGLRVSHKGV